VLTAAHCLYGPRTARRLPPDALHVLLGYDRGAYQVHAEVEGYHIPARYDFCRNRDFGGDWAVLRLKADLPESHPFLPLADRLPAAGAPMMAAGYGFDRPFMMTADFRCRLSRVDTSAASSERFAPPATLLMHDCLLIAGYSGDPLLQLTSGTCPASPAPEKS
jgi:protease YdgD